MSKIKINISQILKSRIFLIVSILLVLAGVFYGGVCYGRNSVKNTNKSGVEAIKKVPSVPGMSEGKITQVGEKSISIKDLKGKTQDFTLDPKISILSAGKTIKLDELKNNDNVRVYFKVGSQIVNRIILIPVKKK